MSLKTWASVKAGDGQPFAHITRLTQARELHQQAVKASEASAKDFGDKYDKSIAANDAAKALHQEAHQASAEIASHPETFDGHRAAWNARAAAHKAAVDLHESKAAEAASFMAQPRHKETGRFIPKR